MFTADMQNYKILEERLKAFSEKAIPFATRQTINDLAFAASSKAKENIRKEFVLRNKFTEKSIRVTTTRERTISAQRSVVGSVVAYMEEQEFGGTTTKRGKFGVPIPTSYSAGLSESAKPRSKMIRKPNKMSSISISNKNRAFKSKKQAAKVSVIEAVKRGRKYIFMELDRTKGLFKITGGKNKPKIKMVYDLTRTSIKTKARPWLRPASQEVIKNFSKIYIKNLEYQLKRFKA